MKKTNTPKRVSVNRKINGEISLNMRMKSPRYSVSVDRKREKDKYACRGNREY